ncbi:hypothetical protein [Oceanisphaera ostreae]|uniref:Uncharacterized protein n=1 Tax=Oceanisphaera ostreae TaxID=914151 RepID=A0ABW3KKH6_9GAMM
MDFEEIAKAVLLKKAGKPIEARRCPDQYVGLIAKFPFNADFPERISVERRPSDIKCVVMILESPHIDEFTNSLGPAKGQTGKLIRAHFLQVNGLSEYINHGLILMNAVQNQCSLGSSTDCYRDEVFATTWHDGAKEDFVRRLNSTFQIGDVIVNCCTKGKMKNNELRQLVQQSIPSDKGEVLRRTHPSSWYSEQNRRSQWKLA